MQTFSFSLKISFLVKISYQEIYDTKSETKLFYSVKYLHERLV